MAGGAAQAKSPCDLSIHDVVHRLQDAPVARLATSHESRKFGCLPCLRWIARSGRLFWLEPNRRVYERGRGFLPRKPSVWSRGFGGSSQPLRFPCRRVKPGRVVPDARFPSGVFRKTNHKRVRTSRSSFPVAFLFLDCGCPLAWSQFNQELFFLASETMSWKALKR